MNTDYAINRIHLILRAAWLVLGFSFVLLSQTSTGSITGTVTDPSGGAVVGARIVLTNTATSESRTVATTQQGFYSFQLLQPATYRLDASAAGFKRLSRENIKIDVGQVVAVDLNLPVGDMSQSITVAASTPALESESSSLGQILDNKSITELPINGRNSYGFAQLVPGVRAPNLFSQVPYGTYNDQFISINGSRVDANQFFLDGGTNSTEFNGPNYYPSVDLVQEYKVQTNNFSAEYGNTSGGVINVVTKSGTNSLHGSAYEFLRNDKLDANDFFANRAGKPKAPIRFNQFGGTVGGPVIIPHVYDGKDRTFFFFSYEGLRWVRDYVTSGTMPTLLQRSGDFSQTSNANGQPITIYDPAATTPVPGQPGQYVRSRFPNNKIPLSRMDPVALALLRYTPLPNTAGNPITGANNFSTSLSGPLQEDSYSIRVDQKITENQKIFVRWSGDVQNDNRPNLFGAPQYAASQNGYGVDNQHHQAPVANYNWVINPTTVLELSSSVMDFLYTRANPANGFNPTTLGLPAYFNNVPLASCFPNIVVAGFSTTVNIPDNGSSTFIGDCEGIKQRFDSFYDYANLTMVRGAHTFKMGGNWGLNHMAQEPRPATQTYTFSPSFTQGPNPIAASSTGGFGFASLLLGAGDSGNIQTSNPGQFIAYHYYGLYVEDDWKLTSKLTLNLGFRYDFNAPWSERYNRINNWNGNSPSPLQVAGLNLKGGLEFPGVGGMPQGQFQNDRTNFAPRFGFAYSANTKTVLRGGFGIFYGPINGSGFAGNMTAFSGFSATTSWVSTINGVTPANYLSNPYPNGFNYAAGSSLGLLSSLGQDIQTVDRGRLTPYAEQWNFGFQRTLPGNFLADLSYAGSHGVHLFGNLNYDQLPNQDLALGSALRTIVNNPFYGVIPSGPLSTATVQAGQLLRPFPQFNSVTAESASYGNSIYHSFQMKVQRRFTNGLGLLASYTFSKLIDDTPPATVNLGFPGENFSAGLVQDYYNRRAARSVASFDTPNYLSLSATYELPLGRGKAFLNHSSVGNAILGGWQLNGISVIHSGQPLGLTTASSTAYNYGSTQYPNYLGGPVGTPGPTSDKLNNYFNVNAFGVPAPYTLGNAGRLLPYLRAPGQASLDLSIYKNIPIHERAHMQFRFEAFNVLNHPQFDAPNTVIGSSTAGVISDQVNSPRDIQLALKLLF